MTPHQFIGLSARIAALWLFLYGLNQASAAWLLHDQALPAASRGVLEAFALVYVAAAVLIALFPMLLAHALLPRAPLDDRLVLQGRQALTVACIVLGLALGVFRALPHLTGFLAALITYAGSGLPITAMPLDQAYSGALGLAEILVALALIRGAQTFTLWAMPRQRLDDLSVDSSI